MNLQAALRSDLRPLLTITAALLLITAVAYPLTMTGVGQLIFGDRVNGSIVTIDGVEVGSSLIGQSFTSPEYFHGRPSAAGAGYDAASSSGSNLGPTSAKLILGVEDDPATSDTDESFAGIVQRVEAFRETNGLDDDAVLPADSVTASASGLDPHISPATARLQVARVAGARGVSTGEVQAVLDDFTDGAFLGFIGEERVNVLMLNIELDRRFPVGE